jgi:hypothetical protein
MTMAMMATVLFLAGCSKKSVHTFVSTAPDTPVATSDTPSETLYTLHIITYDTLTDERDGKKYVTVAIGGKIWMAENLNYETDSSWCYNNDTSYCNKYGRLYNRDAAMSACPDGWYAPSSQEWDGLARSVGGKIDPKDESNGDYWLGAGKKLLL